MSATDDSTLSRDSGDTGGTALRPTPHLVLALECDHPSGGASRHALSGIDEVILARGPAREHRRSGRVLTLAVPDRRVSSEHARLSRHGARWIIEDRDSKNGTFVHGARTQRATLDDGDVLEIGNTLFLFRAALPTGKADPPDLASRDLSPLTSGLATLVPSFALDLTALAHVARSDVPIVLIGETGTGKEVLARAVHTIAGRAGDLVAVNCGAIPESLVESELFGAKKGAFSGATGDRPGLVRAADKGTLFLDEIGDLPRASQASLLRVIQEREVVPVGGSRPVPVDLRVVAATHVDLEPLVERGEFRRDLFARLAGFVMRLPALRDRREDIGALLPSLVDDPAALTLHVDAGRALLQHEWPLNIRELQQCLRRGVALAHGGPIGLDHLPEPLRRLGEGPRPRGLNLSAEDEQLRVELVNRLTEQKGNVSHVAAAMGKARAQIHRWLRRFAIDPDSFRE
jgi:transcriptional regulator of acetoin/glycerol metabolism